MIDFLILKYGLKEFTMILLIFIVLVVVTVILIYLTLSFVNVVIKDYKESPVVYCVDGMPGSCIISNQKGGIYTDNDGVERPLVRTRIPVKEYAKFIQGGLNIDNKSVLKFTNAKDD